MTRKQAKTILDALVADGMEVERLTPQGRQEIRDAVDVVLALADRTRRQTSADQGDATK